MIRKDKKTLKDGTVKTQIRVTEGYRPFPGSPPRQRTVKSFGYLEDHDDVVAFWAEVNACNNGIKKKRDVRIEIPISEMMYSTNNRTLNYGYKFAESVYKALDIDSFIEKRQSNAKSRAKYSVEEIFRYLVMDRILHPASKRGATSRMLTYYGMTSEFDLTDVYRALDDIDDFFYELQRHISNSVTDMVGRCRDYTFYDVTNYYTETDIVAPDETYVDRNGNTVTGPALEQKGVSKEHRVSPIVQMGLFMDSNGIPICMDVFPGNAVDADTLKENLRGFKEEYGKRTVVVADKGMNCARNIDILCSQGDGYVFSQILRGTKGSRYNKDLFDETGWTVSQDGKNKWKLLEEEYDGHEITFAQGNENTAETSKIVKRRRKVLLYWSKADADRAAKKREEKLAKAKKSIGNRTNFFSHGSDKYIKEDIIEKETGTVLGKKEIAKVSDIDHDKADKEALYDGYFAIVTSEMDYDANKILDVYHGLWKIEESFRIMKSDFEARPIFLKKRKHIRAHFLICFTALVIVRMIQHCMGKEPISAERIATALGEANCLIERGGYVRLPDVGGKIKYLDIYSETKNKMVPSLQFSHEDQISLDYKKIQETFGTDFYYAYAKQEDFKWFFAQMKLKDCHGA